MKYGSGKPATDDTVRVAIRAAVTELGVGGELDVDGLIRSTRAVWALANAMRGHRLPQGSEIAIAAVAAYVAKPV